MGRQLPRHPCFWILIDDEPPFGCKGVLLGFSRDFNSLGFRFCDDFPHGEMWFLAALNTTLAGVLVLKTLTNIRHVRNFAVRGLTPGLLALSPTLATRGVRTAPPALGFASAFASIILGCRLGMTVLAVFPFRASILQMESTWDFGLVTFL